MAALFLIFAALGPTCSAHAQVISINAVGYVNISFPPGYSLISKPLFDPYDLAHFIPNPPNGTTVIKVDGNGFQVSNYRDSWTLPELRFLPGEGFFIRNPAATNITITIVGNVCTGRILNRLPAGHSICSSIIPQSANLSLLQFGPPAGTVVYRYDNASQNYTTNLFDGSQWLPAEPSIKVGEAFRVRTPAGYDWVRAFSLTARAPQGWTPVPPEVVLLPGLDGLWIESLTAVTQKNTPRAQSYGNFNYQVAPAQLTSQIGEVNFFTHHASATLGLVQDAGTAQPVTSAFLGQLYAGAGPEEARLVPVGPVTSFSSGRIAGSSVKVPGTVGGQTAWFQLRAWEASHGPSYEEAVSHGGRRGKSVVFPLIVQSPVVGDQPGLPPPDANQFPSFSVHAAWDLTPRFTTIWTSANHAHLTFASEAGGRYRVEYKDDLGAAWTPLGSELTATESGTTQFTHARPPAQACRFYRLRRLP